MSASTVRKIYQMLTSEDDGRACRDIPEEACKEQPGNFLKHVISLSLTKTGDGIANPKLTLAWLITALDAPAGMVGLLVPIREAGSLLPQLATAGFIRSMERRKGAWAAGSLVQGLAIAGIALVALRLEGATAGWALVALLAVFALARSVCSVSYKDVLGKTVSKNTRGTATGTAASISAAFVLAFGALISVGIIPLTINAIAAMLLVAAGLWLVAGSLFATLAEAPGATGGGRNALAMAIQQMGLLKTDAPLRRFILTRSLLTATALSPPYLLALSGEDGGSGLGALGPFVVASALASLSSAYVWGRLADRSSRKALILAGLVAALALAVAALSGLAGVPATLGTIFFPALLFVLMIAHEGVRLGRSTHLVDMATPDTRAAYTALSNTIIGVMLLLAGGGAAIAQALGYAATLGLFALMALLASISALSLDDVQSIEEH